MSEEWGAPEGANGNYKPFDRHALEASLADALKDASEVDETGDYTGAPVPPPDPAGQVRAPNPFGRPNAPAGAIPAPAPAPRPSAPSVPPRTGPSILSGGIAGGVSPVGGLGGSSVSGFRPPANGGGFGLGNGAGLGATGLGPRPLGPLGGMSAEDPPEPAATINLKPRPARPGAEMPEAAPAAAPVPVPTPSRPLTAMAGWTPGDDDILPAVAGGRRRRVPKALSGPRVKAEKAPKESKLKLRRG